VQRGFGGAGVASSRGAHRTNPHSPPGHRVADIRLRPRSATETVDAAFQIYRRDPLPYLAVTTVVYLPWLVVQLLVVGPTPEDQIASLGTGVGMFIATGTWISLSVVSALIVRVSSDVYLHGRRADLASTLPGALPRIPLLMISAALRLFLVAVGIFAFFIGALYMLARFFAVDASIVLENRSVGEAFGRSSKLSKDRKRHILAALALIVLVLILSSLAVGFIAGMANSVVIDTLLSTIVTIAAYPLFGITEMLLYYDARIRDEGFDIEAMAAALGSDGRQ
jgi:hypothetical protein